LLVSLRRRSPFRGFIILAGLAVVSELALVPVEFRFSVDDCAEPDVETMVFAGEAFDPVGGVFSASSGPMHAIHALFISKHSPYM